MNVQTKLRTSHAELIQSVLLSKFKVACQGNVFFSVFLLPCVVHLAYCAHRKGSGLVSSPCWVQFVYLLNGYRLYRNNGMDIEAFPKSCVPILNNNNMMGARMCDVRV
jgi:hypothetical protein